MTQEQQKEILQKHFCRYQLSQGIHPIPLSEKALEALCEAVEEIKRTTGLCDKNGVEIHEGDKVQEWIIDEMEKEGGFMWYGEVKLLDGCFHVLELNHVYVAEIPSFLCEINKKVEVVK